MRFSATRKLAPNFFCTSKWSMTTKIGTNVDFYMFYNLMGGNLDICLTFLFINSRSQIQRQKLNFSRNRLPWQHAGKILKCLRIRLQSTTYITYLDIKQFVKIPLSVQIFGGKMLNFVLPKFVMFDL